MQVRFHWRVKDGVVVAPPPQVDVSVVDAEGRPLEQVPGLRLSIWQGSPPPAVPALNPQRWVGDEHAALQYSVPPPGLTPYQLCWRLALGGTLVESGVVLIASRLAAAMRGVALVALVLGLLASALATSVLHDVYAWATAALSSFLGVVSFVEGLRTKVAGWLWSTRASAAVTLVMLGVIALLLLGLRAVANLTPEPVIVGGRKLQPLALQLVWGSSYPKQEEYVCLESKTTASAPGVEPLIQSPWPPDAPLDGPTWLLDWFRWIRRLDCVCRTPVPGVLQNVWRKVAHCDPHGLETDLAICDAADAKASVPYTDRKIWAKTVDGAAQCWRGDGSTLWFDGKRAFEITSQGRTSGPRTRHPSTGGSQALQALALASDSELEFRADGGALQGSVRFKRTNEKHVPGCVSILNEAGMSSIALSGSAGDAGSLYAVTLIDKPWWTRDLPLCFFRDTSTIVPGVSLEPPTLLPPTRMEIVLADGWVPHASGSIRLPSGYLPRLTPPSKRSTVDGLTIRTIQGTWLATFWFSRLAGDRQVLIVPSPSSWSPVAEHARVQWEQRGNLSRVSGTEVLELVDGVRLDVPTNNTTLGGIAWSVWYTGKEPSSATSDVLDFVLEDDERPLRHQLHLDASSLRIMATPPGACYFARGLLAQPCTERRKANPKEEPYLRDAALNARRACSAYYMCKEPP